MARHPTPPSQKCSLCSRCKYRDGVGMRTRHIAIFGIRVLAHAMSLTTAVDPAGATRAVKPLG
ncbi:hypothetical protein BGW80DRAFT_1313720 [Lactifluus volemus]|nr:hypothetical protein BGW80DRAFT_1313720 [Lactifluus volemus]